jgi:hypothetical protein
MLVPGETSIKKMGAGVGFAPVVVQSSIAPRVKLQSVNDILILVGNHIVTAEQVGVDVIDGVCKNGHYCCLF